MQELERKLADADDQDRRYLGDALVDHAKPPVAAAAKLRPALEAATRDLEAVQYAAERAGQELDSMPAANRDAWLSQTRRDFQTARADYEHALATLLDARERLAQEAQLLDYLTDSQRNPIRLSNTLRVSTSGVDGLVHDVPTADALEALREELVELEYTALTACR